MKAFVVVLFFYFISSFAFSQNSEDIYFHNGDHITPVLSDPHLQLHSEADTNQIKTNNYPVKSILEIVNKDYDSLFIIDEYGHHIFDMNIKSEAKKNLLEIQITTWENGSYEVIAIKNNEAYHQRIVKL
jgi:hypothetical protein